MLPMVRYICERMSASSKSSPLFDNVLVNFLSISLTSSSGNEVSKIAGVDNTTWCNKPSIELSPAEEDSLREDDVTDDDVESVRLGITKNKLNNYQRFHELYDQLFCFNLCTKNLKLSKRCVFLKFVKNLVSSQREYYCTAKTKFCYIFGRII